MTLEGIGCSKPKPGTPEAKAARAEGMKWLRVGVELGSREAHRHLRYLQTHKDWLGGDPTLDYETEWVHPDDRITPPGCQKWISWSDQKRIDGPVESSARSHSPLSPFRRKKPVLSEVISAQAKARQPGQAPTVGVSESPSPKRSAPVTVDAMSPAATVQRHDGKNSNVWRTPDKSKSEEFLFAHQPHV